MQMYRVSLEAHPTRGSAEFGEVGGASVDIFVKASSLIEAVQKGTAYLMSRLWVVTSEQAAFQMTPERIALLDAIGAKTLARAEKEGLFSFFSAWPVTDRTDDAVEIRPMRDSDKSSPSKH